jgi:cyclopropane fatty-acyl-phospholipid synthase-like methyltransferase
MAPARPFAQSCENNKRPIGDVLERAFAGVVDVLEIGSGTGQHAVYLAARMPWLTWHTSDLVANHAGIQAWLDDAKLANVRPPLVLDAGAADWPCRQPYDAVFTANTLHIMAWPEVEGLFRGLGRWLARGGVFCAYGPFNYQGRYTSDSNARFDQWLRQQAPHQAIRNLEDIERLAAAQGIVLQADHAMPANNRLLEWLRPG